jgi:hypothetical protein
MSTLQYMFLLSRFLERIDVSAFLLIRNLMLALESHGTKLYARGDIVGKSGWNFSVRCFAPLAMSYFFVALFPLQSSALFILLPSRRCALFTSSRSSSCVPSFILSPSLRSGFVTRDLSSLRCALFVSALLTPSLSFLCSLRYGSFTSVPSCVSSLCSIHCHSVALPYPLCRHLPPQRHGVLLTLIRSVAAGSISQES